MMTFLVDGDIRVAISLLDDKRLGKQRVEAYQLINILEGKSLSKGWKNHPALKMWVGYLSGLKFYYNCCVKEWIARGKKNTMELYSIIEEVVFPWWTTWERLHYSHQAMLNRKESSFYSFSVPEEYKTRGYIWPHKLSENDKDIQINEITVILTPELLNPKYCSSLLKSGKRTGSQCMRLLKAKQERCGIHNKK
jgi:hypothetical protein